MAKSLLTQLRAFTTEPPPAGMPSDTAVLFAPRDNVRAAVALAVGSAKVSLSISMFTLTDPVLDAILHTKAALVGFDFRMSLDASEVAQSVPMAALVQTWALDLGQRVVYGSSTHNEISHMKAIVIDHEYILSGSTNLTVAGQMYEDNELIVRRHPVLAQRYEQRQAEVFAYMLSKFHLQPKLVGLIV